MRRSEPDAPAGAVVWLLALWLFAATDPLYPLLIRGPSELITDFSGVAASRRPVWAGLYLLAAAALWRWRAEGAAALLGHAALAPALAWFGLSCLWAPAPADAAAGFAQFALLLAAGAAAGAAVGPLGAAQAVARMAALALAGSAVMAAVSPEHALGQQVNAGALRGIYVEKNHLATILSYGVGAALFEALARPRARRRLLALAAVLAAGAVAARSSIALLQLALAGALALGWAGLARARYGGAVAALAAVSATAAVAAALPAALAALGEDLTLNGRTTLWAALWPKAQAAPWIGHGFHGAFAEGDLDALRALLGWNARGAHSGWLTALLYGGAVGLALWLSVWIGVLRRAAGALRPGGEAGAAALGMVAAAHLGWSLFESNQLLQMNLHAALAGLCLSLPRPGSAASAAGGCAARASTARSRRAAPAARSRNSGLPIT